MWENFKKTYEKNKLWPLNFWLNIQEISVKIWDNVGKSRQNFGKSLRKFRAGNFKKIMS